MRRAALLAACLLTATAESAAQANGRILVMPFENVTHDSRIVWLGEASAVLIADDLNALGARAIAVSCARGSASGCGRAQQSGSGAAAARRHTADRIVDVLLFQGR